MTWLSSILVALLTAALGLFLSGFVASLAVDWYRISSFEGGSGYFVIGLALLGGIISFGLGLLASRYVAAHPEPGILKALGFSVGGVAGILGVIAGVARLLADVPPEIAGEGLFFQVEVRWPAGDTTDPRTLAGVGSITLGSMTISHVRRKAEDGPLFVADARQVEGRWVVPGAVRIFTNRGRRLLSAQIGDKDLGGVLIPQRGQPSARDTAWTEWYPRARPGAPALPDTLFTYRYRVTRQSEPVRVDQVGPFEVATISNYFFTTGDTPEFSAYSRFRVSLGGAPVPVAGEISGLAVVPGDPPALLASVEAPDETQGIWLVTAGADGPRVERVSTGQLPTDPMLITSDPARFRASRDRTGPRGWIDRTSFAEPGLYRFWDAIFDSRTRHATPLTLPEDPFPLPSPGLLTVSPDERSVVWLAHADGEAHPVLGVTDYVAKESYTLPIDRMRMRYGTDDSLDPAWVAHHFAWERGAGGVDRLVERKAFTPLPYRVERSAGKPGEWQGLTLRPGGEALRSAIVAAMVAELGAERAPGGPDDTRTSLRLEGMDLGATVIESEGYVSISTYHGDPAAMARIADRLDALLATGRFDSLFVR